MHECRGDVDAADLNANGTNNGSDLFTVCTLERQPMSYCPQNSWSTFSELSIQAFREAAEKDLNWKEGENYKFVCLDLGTSELIEKELLPENGTCDAFIASTTITAERTKMGVVWAFPYWTGSIGIMVKSDTSTSSGWAWVQPFTWDLWLALGITVLLLPIVLYLFEILTIRESITAKDAAKGYSEAAWRTLWLVIQGTIFHISVLGARVIVIVVAFMSLILGASYTANLAAFLTLRSAGDLNSVYDLIGLAVSTVPLYVDKLKMRYGIIALEASIGNMEDIEREADLVVNGNLASFVTDAEVIQRVVATFPECKVRMLPQTIEPFEYGLAFSSRTNESIVSSFSLGILQLIETGRIYEIGEEFLLSNSPCLKQGLTNDGTQKIGFKQVYGLWIMIGVAIGIGFLIVIGTRIYKTKKGHWHSDEKEESSQDDKDEYLPPEKSVHARGVDDGSRKKRLAELERQESFIMDIH